MDDVATNPEIREKFRHFRILVIGRANAGKTTLLKRVCNTTDEPCIYDEENNNLLEPTSERGSHDVWRAFAFASNPEFIFHDSPGFETGDENQLKEVQSFIAKRAEATEVADQLHTIWFCFTPDISRPLLDLEKRFFNEPRAGNVPVIAIYTKFDDLITQIYDESLDEERNHQIANHELQNKFQAPLFGYKFPPRADIRVEDLHEDNSSHQEQVKELIEKTADSLDNLTLKKLFVSIQQNNLELCIRYAVKYGLSLRGNLSMENGVRKVLEWFRHSYYENYDYGRTEPENPPPVPFTRNCASTARFMISKFNIIESSFPLNCSLAITAGLILCSEASFWYTSRFKFFMDAFSKAFESYIKTGTKQKVEMALQTLGNWPDDRHDEETFKGALVDILLRYRLSHLNTLEGPN